MNSSSAAISSLFVLSFAASITLGCNANKPPTKTAGDCVKMGAHTGYSGAKTGVTTGVEGVKAAGSAVGGYFEGGANEADRKWEAGKANTRAIAKEGAGETSKESHSPDCP